VEGRGKEIGREAEMKGERVGMKRREEKESWVPLKGVKQISSYDFWQISMSFQHIF